MGDVRVNLSVAGIFFAVACLVGLLSPKNVKPIRRIVLTAALLAAVLCCVLLVFEMPGTPVVLFGGAGSREAALAAMICACFFLVLFARGTASKREMVNACFFMASGMAALFAHTFVYYLVAVVLLFFFAAVLVKVKRVRNRASVLRVFFAVAFTAGGSGIAAVVVARSGMASLQGISPYLIAFLCLCLFSSFPLHFWLPRLLPETPFLVTVMLPLLFPRVGLVGYLHFAGAAGALSQVNELFVIFGIAGALWCSIASFASHDSAEKFGYIAGAHSAVVVWALGKGFEAEAFYLFFITAPAFVLFGVGISVLFSRLKTFRILWLSGMGMLLTRFTVLFAVSIPGLAFFPGFSSFYPLVLLMGRKPAVWEVWCIAAAVLVLFLSIGSVFVRLCFEDIRRGSQGVGDLNKRELWAAVPSAVWICAGLWPGFAAFWWTLIDGLPMIR